MRRRLRAATHFAKTASASWFALVRLTLISSPSLFHKPAFLPAPARRTSATINHTKKNRTGKEEEEEEEKKVYRKYGVHRELEVINQGSQEGIVIFKLVKEEGSCLKGADSIGL